MNHGWKTLLFLILAVLLFAYATNSKALSTSALSVPFIDVGQGDSILIHDSSGFDALIDGGKSPTGPTVVAYLREQSVDDIDLLQILSSKQLGR